MGLHEVDLHANWLQGLQGEEEGSNKTTTIIITIILVTTNISSILIASMIIIRYSFYYYYCCIFIASITTSTTLSIAIRVLGESGASSGSNRTRVADFFVVSPSMGLYGIYGALYGYIGFRV